MTVVDLIAVLQQCEDPKAEVTAIVYEYTASDPLPLLSHAAVRDVREIRGTVVLCVEGR